METWTLNQITDPKFLDELKRHTEEINGLVILELSDGRIKVSKRQALLNLIWWKILTTFNIPIRRDHFLKRKPLNKGSLTAFWDNYYEEVMAQSQTNAKLLKRTLWDVMNEMYAWCFDNLLPYVSTIDIVDMANIMTDGPMKEQIESKKNIKEWMSTTDIEYYIESHRKVIMDMLGTPGALKCEALLPYQSIKMLNKFQVPQTMYAFGVRTDVNDNIVRKPVLGSAIDGLRDIHEFAVESLSAKKSMFYNKNSVAEAQYFGRQQHLICSTVQHLYYGDCGSTQLVDFEIRPDDDEAGIPSNAHNVIGKVIVEDGKYVTLTKKNVGNYMGKIVHMRSPMTCRYKDGVCEVCGGRILGNLNRKINIGILSAIHTIEPVTQKILSAKHLIKTKSIIYQLPDNAKGVLEQVNTNEIRWSHKILPFLHQCKLGIPTGCFKGFHDVLLIRSDKPINEYKISRIDRFFIQRGEKCNEYSLYQEKRTPYISSDFLLAIRDRYDSIEIKDDIIWIPMKDTDRIPIFRTIVTNDNMIEFVNSVKSFLGGPIKKCTTCSEALSQFSDIIYSKVDANIVHIEVLLKAYEISSNTDWRIPIVEDVNNVQFETISAILSNRHVGVRLAYQYVNGYISNPTTYTQKRQKSPFDRMVGYLN